MKVLPALHGSSQVLRRVDNQPQSIGLHQSRIVALNDQLAATIQNLTGSIDGGSPAPQTKALDTISVREHNDYKTVILGGGRWALLQGWPLIGNATCAGRSGSSTLNQGRASVRSVALGSGM